MFMQKIAKLAAANFFKDLQVIKQEDILEEPIMWSVFCILQHILCNELMHVTYIFLDVMCKVAVT
jgi:hypothetical protein